MVRSGESKARVSGILSMERTPELDVLLSEAGIEFESEDEVIVEREISSSGKSRAWTYGRSSLSRAFCPVCTPAPSMVSQSNSANIANMSPATI